MEISEVKTRQNFIDQQLSQAGWGLNNRNLLEEFPLAGLTEKDENSNTFIHHSKELLDYVLKGQNGLPIAIVEAKRSSRDSLAGKRQAADYADHLRAQYGIEPFI